MEELIKFQNNIINGSLVTRRGDTDLCLSSKDTPPSIRCLQRLISILTPHSQLSIRFLLYTHSSFSLQYVSFLFRKSHRPNKTGPKVKTLKNYTRASDPFSWRQWYGRELNSPSSAPLGTGPKPFDSLLSNSCVIHDIRNRAFCYSQLELHKQSDQGLR